MQYKNADILYFTSFDLTHVKTSPAISTLAECDI